MEQGLKLLGRCFMDTPQLQQCSIARLAELSEEGPTIPKVVKMCVLLIKNDQN